jgi:hypothetical protein
MELEFRVDKCLDVDYSQLFIALKKIAYRFLVCWENKDKNGKSCKEHYHGYIECDGEKTTRQNQDKVRNIIKKYTTGKSSDYFVRQMKNDTKTALAYCYKQQHLVDEYNISYTFEDLAERWQEMKEKWQEDKKQKLEYKDEIINYFLERDYIPTTLDEIKLIVAQKMVDDKKLPTMGKVRSYTLYLVLSLKLNISYLDLYKCI